MTRRRGDNIPTVADYAHWNEDAQRVWYEENRYDMEHADEEIEDDDDLRHYDREDDPYQAQFATEAQARAFMAKWAIDESRDTISDCVIDREGTVVWLVEHYSDAGQKSYKRDHA